MTVARHPPFKNRIENAVANHFRLMRHILIVIFLLFTGAAGLAQTWKPLGPPGGDGRTMVANPSRPGTIFLGTADGHIFSSEDAGTNWKLLGRASNRLD